ncbi:hypothetical protein ACFQX6_11165 [Streptosporangium lutulentum]
MPDERLHPEDCRRPGRGRTLQPGALPADGGARHDRGAVHAAPGECSLLWQETGGWHGGGLAYHAPFPYQVGQEPRETPCEYVPGGQCFYDVSYTGSESILRQWWDAGRDDDVVWRAAELLYREFFVDMTPEEHLRTPEEFLEALAKLVDDEETGK